MEVSCCSERLAAQGATWKIRIGFGIPPARELGIGRFSLTGVPAPQIMGPFLGGVEIACGTLILIALITRIAGEAQFANLFDINNWGIPNLNVASGRSFGKISSEQDGTPGSQTGPRSIQMALRLSF